MSRPESWESLPSFKITPGKTFFGLDKSRSYCFTLPKDTYAAFIEHFELSADKLQQDVFFIIDSISHRYTTACHTRPIKNKKIGKRGFTISGTFTILMERTKIDDRCIGRML